MDTGASIPMCVRQALYQWQNIPSHWLCLRPEFQPRASLLMCKRSTTELDSQPYFLHFSKNSRKLENCVSLAYHYIWGVYWIVFLNDSNTQNWLAWALFMNYGCNIRKVLCISLRVLSLISLEKCERQWVTSLSSSPLTRTEGSWISTYETASLTSRTTMMNFLVSKGRKNEIFGTWRRQSCSWRCPWMRSLRHKPWIKDFYLRWVWKTPSRLLNLGISFKRH